LYPRRGGWATASLTHKAKGVDEGMKVYRWAKDKGAAVLNHEYPSDVTEHE